MIPGEILDVNLGTLFSVQAPGEKKRDTFEIIYCFPYYE